MKTIFVLFDDKTKAFSLFGLFMTQEEARRSLAINLLRTPDIPPSIYPADFTLFAAGLFNPSAEANPFSEIALVSCGTAAQILADYVPAKKNVENKDKAENA